MATIIATLNMEGTRLGIEVEPAMDGAALLVKNVFDGAVSNWNVNNPPSQSIMPGAHVLSINDVTRADAMINEVKSGKKTLVVVAESTSSGSTENPLAGSQPLRTFKIQLEMSSGLKLGIDMDFKSDPRRIIINNVKSEGAVGHWNITHPEFSVSAGDCIIALNNVEGDAKAMINEGTTCFKAKQNVSMMIEKHDVQSSGLRGTKRSAPAGFQQAPAEGASEWEVFVANLGLTQIEGDFLRQQSPPIQEAIMRKFKEEAARYTIRDPIGQVMAISKRILNESKGKGSGKGKGKW